MEHETNGLVLIFLGETPACRQDVCLRLVSAAAYDQLSTRSGTVHITRHAEHYNAYNTRLMQNPEGVSAVTPLTCTDTVYDLVLREFCITLHGPGRPVQRERVQRQVLA